MRRPLSLLVLICALGLPSLAAAQRSPVVLELYTSQGCSSCPAADALFGELAGQTGVIALALHVDYWDYLGWKDSFGQAAHTKRQRGYAKKARERSIYTPQIVIEGVDRAIGSDRERVLALIAAHQSQPAPITLALQRDADRLRIEVDPVGGRRVGPATVYLVRFATKGAVDIEHGENAGHTLPFTHAVTDWTAVAQWDGITPAEFELEVTGPEPGAVIVQAEHLGPVLNAAYLP